MIKSNISVIIVAGGSGTRMGEALPKQFLTLGDKPILGHTIDNFAGALPGSEIVVVLPEEHIELWEKLSLRYGISQEYKVVAGGSDRTSSVNNGLQAIESSDGIVMVHDGVRPLVSPLKIREIAALAIKCGTAIPCINIIDSLRHVGVHGNKAVDREEYKAVQTPQAFQLELLRKGYKEATEHNLSFGDDASVVENLGTKVTLIEGERTNIKITTPIDMIIANKILENTVKQ